MIFSYCSCFLDRKHPLAPHPETACHMGMQISHEHGGLNFMICLSQIKKERKNEPDTWSANKI